MSESTSTTASREAWGDSLKGLLIVFVVLWHVIMKSYLQVAWQIDLPIPGAWGLIGDVLWSFMMPLFLAVSGYFAANAFRRDWSAVIRTRIVRYYYLYLLWSLIHMAALWAFPDFPTLIPRTAAQVIEYLTISPPNTWYLYALALYFLVAKALSRVASWIVISGAVVLSIAVSAGYIDVVSNRGSLLYNFTFFLLGLHLAPQIRRAIEHVRPRTVAAAAIAFMAAFAAMRLTGSEATPGVWLIVSLLGVTMGLLAARMVSRVPKVGAGLAALGRRSLPIYVIHMPLLALADLVVVGWLSDARIAIQLVAAVVLPVLLTALVVAASLLLNRLATRDRLFWLFDLPRLRRQATDTRMPRARDLRERAPWRLMGAVLCLALCGVLVTRAAEIPGCAPSATSTPALQRGEVSIGATGDVLIHDVGHRVPPDGGVAHFDEVRSWFDQDLVTANLEQAISDGTGYRKCGDRADCLTFRSAPSTADYFGGFDLLNLANNHSGDFGPAGVTNTRHNLAGAGIRTVGARDEISCSTIGDTTVAVVGFAPYGNTNRVSDLRHVRKLVDAAARSADVVIVHAHMGAEGPDANVVAPGTERMYGEDRGDVMAFSRAAIDSGADLVLGHGPHTLRGMEFYKGRLIAYSLGNFGGGGVFGAELETRYGVYLEASLRKDGSFAHGRLRSVHFDFEDGRPLPDPRDRAAELVDAFSQRDFPGTAPRIDQDGTLSPPRK